MRQLGCVIASSLALVVAGALLVTIQREPPGLPPGAPPPATTLAAPAPAVRPNELVPRLWLRDPRAAKLEFWRAKPLLKELIDHPLNPTVTAKVREDAARLKAGEFQPFRHFDWLPLGVPPPWDENPVGSNTWDLWRHTLRWIQPLVAVWHSEDDEQSLRLLQETIRDWRDHNQTPPGASRYAWNDHAVAARLGNLCWLWELYRTSDAPGLGFSRLLLELIHSHAEFIASGVNYNGKSNHGLMQNLALLEAAALLPEFEQAQRWRAIVAERMQAYMRDNFSPEGFHLEQAPAYHGFVVNRIGIMLRFLRINELPKLSGLDQEMRRAASVTPFLLRPDGLYVGIGDSWILSPRNYKAEWKRWWGADIPSVAGSTSPTPRSEPGEFVLSFDAGYAIFTAYDIAASKPDPDTHVFYKCNAFKYAHNHADALSFVLYGLGRDWLIDSGVHSHDQVPERHYVISPRAHNLVLVDEKNFPLGKVELIDSGRTLEGDFVTARHHLPTATHTRTLRFLPPYQVELRDDLSSTDGKPHTYTQVFHVGREIELRIISDRRVELVGKDGARCVIEQKGVAGAWRVIEGQKQPYWQGWFSPAYNKIEPSPALYYSTVERQVRSRFVTTIQLAKGGSEGVRDEGKNGDWSSALSRAVGASRIRLTIDTETISLPGHSDRIIDYYRRKKIDGYLREQVELLLTDENVERGLKLRQNVYHFPNHEPTKLPTNPTWSEDPFSSRNWMFWYQQLQFIDYGIAAYKQTGDTWYLRRMWELSADWMTDNVKSTYPSKLSWHDHATALRLRRLLLLHAASLDAGMNCDWIPQLLVAVQLHCEVLSFDSFYSRHSNHGLDQSYILFWAACVFPELESASQWRSIGRERVQDELEYAFSTEGLHVENSPGYHHGMLKTVLRVNSLFRHYTGADIYSRLNDLLSDGMRYLAYATRPDGRFPIIGDTLRRKVSNPFGTLSELSAYHELEYSLSGGRRGHKPSRADAVYPKSGYAILRDAWHDPGDFDQTVYLFFKCGYLGRYHRQDDDGTFVLYAYGEDWIIDSGLYDHNQADLHRRYMRSERAHNVVTIKGVRPTRDPKQLLGHSHITASELLPDRVSVTGVSGMYPGFLVTRSIVYDKPDRFTITDQVTPEKQRPATYRVLFHVPADKSIQIVGPDVVITGRDGRQLRLTPRDTSFDRTYVVSGQTRPEIQGWVSYDYRKLEKSQCIIFEVRAERLRSSIQMSFEERR